MEQRVLEALDGAGVVAGRLRGDAKAVLGGVADGLGYVLGARYPHVVQPAAGGGSG